MKSPINDYVPLLPSLSNPIHILRALLQPFTDPIGFGEARLNRTWNSTFFWKAWGIVVVILVGISFGFGLIWGDIRIIGLAIIGLSLSCMLAGFLTLLSAGMASDLSGPKFWLYYHVSLPYLLAASICSFLFAPWTAVSELVEWVGWLTLCPFLLGSEISTLGMTWSHNAIVAFHRTSLGAHLGGMPSELPTLGRWRYVRWARMASALAWTLLFIPDITSHTLLSWYGVGATWVTIAGITGCLRLEASLLSLLNYPLVSRTSPSNGWRATYIGRYAIWVPRRKIIATAKDLSANEAALALIALYRDGCLTPSLNASIAHLSHLHCKQLLQAFSLQPGGGAVLEIVAPHLNTPLRALANTYTILAREGARPDSLQRWLLALSRCPLDSLSPEIAKPLTKIHTALTTSRDVALVEQMLQETKPWLYHINSNKSGNMSHEQRTRQTWTEALLAELQAHRQRLLTVQA